MLFNNNIWTIDEIGSQVFVGNNVSVNGKQFCSYRSFLKYKVKLQIREAFEGVRFRFILKEKIADRGNIVVFVFKRKKYQSCKK